MPRTQIEFDQANDLEFASQLELERVAHNNRNPDPFVPSDMSNYDLWLRLQNVGSRANDGNMIFFDPSGKDYVEFQYSTYTDIAHYIYRGSTVWTPVSFMSICGRSSANGTSYIRMLCVASGLVIAELSYTSAADAIRTAVVTQANLPTGLSTFVLQCYNSGNGKTRISAASLYPTS